MTFQSKESTQAVHNINSGSVSAGLQKEKRHEERTEEEFL